MGLCLADHWVWDSWVAVVGDEYHLFFLRASRALGEPIRRHKRASIGHAVSRDLRNWTLLPDALVASDGPAWDDLATWTGSVISDDDGRWHMFYTGVSRSEDGLVQRIGAVESDDLLTWHRTTSKPLLECDPRWYETLDLSVWIDQAWRDPFVFRDPAGDGWHMLLTARAATGPPDGRGVIGHARSPDLCDWQVQEPLSQPAGFGQMEVPQVQLVEGGSVLIFSCWTGELSAGRAADGLNPGTWIVVGEEATGPWDADAARPVDAGIYAARLVKDLDGGWALLGFRDTIDGEFIGEIADPVPFDFDDFVERPR